MSETKVSFPCGELTLEGVLSVPDGKGPFPLVIVCHPHPLYGGDMDNNVVISISNALTRASIMAFRFNFRGVGASQGSHGNGVGEQEDVAAAVSLVSGMEEVDKGRIGLAGYSAGAGFSVQVAVRDKRIKALAMVAPPLLLADFSSLTDCPKPKLLISGSDDDFTPSHRFLQFCRGLAEPREFHVIEGADHFWWGFESSLADRVVRFFSGTLSG